MVMMVMMTTISKHMEDDDGIDGAKMLMATTMMIMAVAMIVATNVMV